MSSTFVPSAYYDAIVIGAGHNGLTCACYLAKSGLTVLVLEDYSLIGGMTITEEITLPSFKSDIHAFGSSLATLSPVPNELNLYSHGFELIRPEISISHLFPKKHGYISMHRSLEKTQESIRKYSNKDAESWEKIFGEYLASKKSIVLDLNTPPSMVKSNLPTDAPPKLNDLSTDGDRFRRKTQSMRSWCNENFESEEVKAMFGSFAPFVGLSPDDAGGGELCYLFASVMQDGGNNVVKGGFVNLPIALARYLQLKGGQIMTKSRVKRIVVQNGRAVGVQLMDGKKIGARKLVASSTDPFTLILSLLGEEHFDAQLISSIKRLEWGDAIFGIYLALNGPLKYNTGQETLSQSPQVHISPPGLEFFSKIFYECRSGRPPSHPLCIMSNDSMVDPTRVLSAGTNSNGSNKHLIVFLVLSVPYKIKNTDDESEQQIEWNEFKSRYGSQIISNISQEYIPNLNDEILKKTIYSPLDYEKKPINSIRGTLACGAVLPYQAGWMRPIPQLGSYKVPCISNVYLCGSGSHPGPGVSMAPGRNAAQIILHDLEADLKNIFSPA